MPAATTHIEFAKDVLRTLDEEQRRKITNLHMYWLGSQGPDMLFFSKASVLPGSLHKYGNLMHNAKVGKVMDFFEHWSAADPDLYSYYMGFLCHYALDSTAHPLINAIARTRHDQAGVHEGSTHVTMEADIDVWMLHQRGRKISSYDVHKMIKVDNECALKLGDMYHMMFSEVYEIEIPAAELTRSVKDASFYTGVLYPNKATNAVIKELEKLLNMPPAISGMVLVGKGNMEVINLDHTAYALRHDPSQTINASFPELYGIAVLKAQKLLKDRNDADFTLNFNGEPQQN